jgi:hypothetical protein
MERSSKLLAVVIVSLLALTGCSSIKEANELDSFAPKYHKAYVAVSSSPSSRFFQDVDLTCKTEATIYQDKKLSDMALQQNQERAKQTKSDGSFKCKTDYFGTTTCKPSEQSSLLAANLSRMDEDARRWAAPQFYATGYKMCMNRSGWDIRRVCRKNCSKEARDLYEIKRAEYKERRNPTK